MNTYQTLLATTQSFTLVGIKSIARTALLAIVSNPVTSLLVSVSILFVTWVVHSLRSLQSKIDTQPKASRKTNSSIRPRVPKDKAGEPKVASTPKSDQAVEELNQQLESLRKEFNTNLRNVYGALESGRSALKPLFNKIDADNNRIIQETANSHPESLLEQMRLPAMSAALETDLKTKEEKLLVAPKGLHPMGISITSSNPEQRAPITLNEGQDVSINYRLNHVIHATAKFATLGSTIEHSTTESYSNTAASPDKTVNIWSLDMPTFYYINSALRSLGKNHGYTWESVDNIDIDKNKWDRPDQDSSLILFTDDSYKEQRWCFLSNVNYSNRSNLSPKLMQHLQRYDIPAITRQLETHPLATPYVVIDLETARNNVAKDKSEDPSSTLTLRSELMRQIGDKARDILHTFVELFDARQTEGEDAKKNSFHLALKLKEQMSGLFQECNPDYPLHGINARSAALFRTPQQRLVNTTSHNPLKSLSSNILDQEIIAAAKQLKQSQ